jgi:pantetheine-phosphate adenylyltransferase
MVKAVFPGSFDPPTYGHLNIIRRGAALFDSLDIVIAINSRKKQLLPAEEIKLMMEEQIVAMNLGQVRVTTYEGLVVDYCRAVGAGVLLRGVRSSADFDYEFELSILNKQLNEAVETVLIPTEPKYFVLRSSTIKELLNLGGDISAMVPPEVEKALLKYRGRGD